MSVSRQVGTFSAVDPQSVRARVRLSECDNMRTNWLDVLQHNTQNNKDYWLPDVGEQVVVLLDENGEGGIILGAVYSSVDLSPPPPSTTRTLAVLLIPTAPRFTTIAKRIR